MPVGVADGHLKVLVPVEQPLRVKVPLVRVGGGGDGLEVTSSLSLGIESQLLLRVSPDQPRSNCPAALP